MDYPGWTIETSHPVEEGAEDYCEACAEAVEPTINFAVRMESPAHQHSFSDDEGITHVIVVRSA
jgi:hypothetical protein